jgi:hypothetical protein
VNQTFWLRFLVTLCLALTFLFIVHSVPVLDVNQRQRRNEASTVARLHRLNDLQNSYAVSHPTKGFSCELLQLKPSGPVDDTYDPDAFLLTGVYGGYRFTVPNCRTDSNGVVTQYQLTAAPLEPGKSGFRAFCTDQTHVMWFASDGSAKNCLALRHPLQ